jgi:hypothetical protein
MLVSDMDGELVLSREIGEKVAALGQRYLWWGEPSFPHSQARVIAQIMNLGTYEDVLRLEALVPRSAMSHVMVDAEPGWFSARSWEFWKGRLALNLPEKPPARRLADV